MSVLLSQDVAVACLLGPYVSPASQLTTVDPVLVNQMQQSAVDEDKFRIVFLEINHS